MKADDRDEGGASVPEPSEATRELFRLARRDAPPADLEERVLASVAYRSRLHGEAKPPSPARRALWGGLLLAAAASVGLWLTRAPDQRFQLVEDAPELGAEPLGSVHGQAPLEFEQERAQPSGSGLPEPARVPAKAAPEDPCRVAVVAAGNEPLIDDFEDGDDAVLPNERRQGLWRWVRDTDAPGTAPALLPVPRPGKTSKNQLALHVKGERLREWGATVEFVFSSKCYDASTYAGISFEAQGSTRIYVAPRQVEVMPVAEGGTCEEDCHNNHVQQIELEPRWRRYEVRFDEVEQRGYDRPRLDAARLHSIAFLIKPEDTPYAVWLDDVRFIERN